MTHLTRHWPSLLLFLLLTGVGANAFAYRQTRTCLFDEERSQLAPSNVVTCQEGEASWPVSWEGRTVSYKISKFGTSDIPSGPDGEISSELVESIIEAVEVWNKPGCSDFTFKYAGKSNARVHASRDKTNLVTFLDEDWPTSQTALAVTTSSMTARGALRDTDIEINGEFATLTNERGVVGTAIDIRNTIAHEAGHMLGLDHSALPSATMEADAPPGEISKRKLSPDDIGGLCTIYPLGAQLYREPQELEDGGCCASVHGGGAKRPGWIVVMLLGLLGGLGLRRRSMA